MGEKASFEIRPPFIPFEIRGCAAVKLKRSTTRSFQKNPNTPLQYTRVSAYIHGNLKEHWRRKKISRDP